MISLRALDARVRSLDPPLKFLVTASLLAFLLVGLPLLIGLLLNQFTPYKEPVVKPLNEVLSDADKAMRGAVTVMLRNHGMTEVEIRNWFSACDNQAQALHALKARELQISGEPADVVQSYLDMPTTLNLALSKCHLPWEH